MQEPPDPFYGFVLFAVALIQTASFLVAPRLAERFGLLPTMVFTHLPSNILLIGFLTSCHASFRCRSWGWVPGHGAFRVTASDHEQPPLPLVTSTQRARVPRARMGTPRADWAFVRMHRPG